MQPSRRFLGHARYFSAGFWLGFAFGGIFDGILFHQILQWHHALSGMKADGIDGIEGQILADGLLHAVLYAVAAACLWALWRTRAVHGAPGGGRRLFADGLVGFGLWNILDSVVFHWLLGLHRVRMDAAQPLVWDVLVLALFGVVPAMGGLLLARHRRGPTGATG